MQQSRDTSEGGAVLSTRNEMKVHAALIFYFNFILASDVTSRGAGTR